MIFLAVVLLATMLASLTDWIFYDVLVNQLYAAAPEVWRPGGNLRIAVSQLLGTLATASAAEVTVLAHGKPLFIALLLWAAGSLPATLQNLQWMRLHPAISASHAVGWLVRLLIATILSNWLL